MAVLLYDLPISHYCVKAKAILAYKGVAFETEHAPYHDRQDLLAVSGQDYVPYLLWEDEGARWHEIPDLVERKVPSPTLYPGGQRSLARILDSWAHDVVEEAVWKCVVADAEKTFADPRERWVFVEMQERRRGPLEVMMLRKQAFLQGLVETMRPAEERFHESAYLLGDAPCLGDFALYGALHPLPYTGNQIPRELPHTRAWFARMEKLATPAK